MLWALTLLPLSLMPCCSNSLPGHCQGAEFFLYVFGINSRTGIIHKSPVRGIFCCFWKDQNGHRNDVRAHWMLRRVCTCLVIHQGSTFAPTKRCKVREGIPSTAGGQQHLLDREQRKRRIGQISSDAECTGSSLLTAMSAS